MFEFGDVNIIYGENGQGKTNLIEAIYIFTGLKSFRANRDNELVNFEKDVAKLALNFTGNNREQLARMQIENTREAWLNEVKKRPSELGASIKAVVFSPQHLSMVKDGPLVRREFVDNALCQIKSSYASVLNKYKTALTQRNALLKDIEKDSALEEMLPVWNVELAKEGAKIIFQRQKFAEALSPYAKEIYAGLSNGREEISLKMVGSFDYDGLGVPQIEEGLTLALANATEDDKAVQHTTVGPHRDDLQIDINGHSARKFASQGQQRSAVLALKLAEGRLLSDMTGVMPVALLDDVMSELDEKRQDYVLNHLNNMQIFVTCCDANSILRLQQGRLFHISEGRLI